MSDMRVCSTRRLDWLHGAARPLPPCSQTRSRSPTQLGDDGSLTDKLLAPHGVSWALIGQTQDWPERAALCVQARDILNAARAKLAEYQEIVARFTSNA